jgi:hypothetical protein
VSPVKYELGFHITAVKNLNSYILTLVLYIQVLVAVMRALISSYYWHQATEMRQFRLAVRVSHSRQTTLKLVTPRFVL